MAFLTWPHALVWLRSVGAVRHPDPEPHLLVLEARGKRATARVGREPTVLDWLQLVGMLHSKVTAGLD